MIQGLRGESLPQKRKAQRPNAELGKSFQIGLSMPVSAKFELIEVSIADPVDRAFDPSPELNRFRDRGEKVASLALGQGKAIEFIDRVQIDRNREQIAIDTGENTVLVLPPGSELREIIEDDFRVRVKNVRAIFVNQKTGLIQAVIRVAANVISAIA